MVFFQVERQGNQTGLPIVVARGGRKAAARNGHPFVPSIGIRRGQISGVARRHTDLVNGPGTDSPSGDNSMKVTRIYEGSREALKKSVGAVCKFSLDGGAFYSRWQPTKHEFLRRRRRRLRR